MKRIQNYFDRLIVWAIKRLHISLPDLQQTPLPRTGKIYYYYGRWLRLVRHDKETAEWVAANINMHNARIPESLMQPLSERICKGCALYQLALPCHKYKGATTEDLCLHYKYQLIKNK